MTHWQMYSMMLYYTTCQGVFRSLYEGLNSHYDITVYEPICGDTFFPLSCSLFISLIIPSLISPLVSSTSVLITSI